MKKHKYGKVIKFLDKHEKKIFFSLCLICMTIYLLYQKKYTVDGVAYEDVISPIIVFSVLYGIFFDLLGKK